MKQLVNLFGRKAKIKATESRTRVPRRALRSETLEKRQLLAGDLLEHHNYAIPEDVNGDWRVTPLDALLVLTHISRNGGSSSLAGLSAEESGQFVDVSGTGEVTPLDALLVLNRIASGEAAGELLQLQLNPRTAGDTAVSASAFNPATRELTVGVGEVFNLELLYRDLRPSGIGNPKLGAFAIYSDILFDPAGQGVLQPVLTETQFVEFSASIDQATSGSLQFSYPGDPSRPGVVTVSLEDFGADEEAPVREMTAAIEQLGFSNVNVTMQARAPGAPLVFMIRYNDFSLSDQDLPNLLVTPQLNVAVTATTRDIAPRNSNNEINNAAVPFNINFDSRTLRQPREVSSNESFFGFAATQVGTFNAATGFIDVGAVGPLLVDGWPNMNLGPLPDPFDAFSLPVKLTQPINNLRIFLDPSNTSSTRNLFYGRTEGLPDELLLLDLDVDPLVAGNGTIEIAQGETGTIDASGITMGLGTTDGTGVLFVNAVTDTSTVDNRLRYEITSQPASGGTASVNGSIITFTPTPGMPVAGPITFTYSAIAGSRSSTGTITVNVEGGSELVVTAGNGSMAAVQNGPVSPLDLSTLVMVQNGGSFPITYALEDGPSFGSVVIDPITGEASFTPSAVQSGQTSFVYSATVNGFTDTGTITVNVAPIVVTAGDDAIGASQNGPVVPFDLNAFVTAPGSTGLTPTFVKLSDPAFGTVTVNSDGTGFYTPALIGFGQTSFDYEVTIGGVTDSGTITVNVTALPVTVVADDIPDPLEAVQSGTPVEFALNGLVTVTNGDGLPRSFVITQPSLGSATVNPSTGALVYTPPTETFGTTSLNYTVTVNGVSDTGTITINVAREPVVLAANPGTLNAFQNGLPVTINLNNLISVTPAGTQVTFELIPPTATLGSAVLGAGGIVTFTPSTTQSGSTSFGYRVTSVGDDIETAESTVSVTVNQEITVIAEDDQLEAIQGGDSIVINPFPGALVSTTGTSTTPTIALNTSGTQGTVSLVNGVLTYTPPTIRFGTDSFSYSASLPAIPGFAGATDTGVITITEVASITARPLNVTALPGDPAQVINLSNLVTITGTDDLPTFTIDDTGLAGTAVLVGNSVTYTPPAVEFGTTSFSFTATVAGKSATSTVTISEGIAIQTLPGSLISFPGGPAVTLSLPTLVTITGSDAEPVYALATQPTVGSAAVNPSTGLVTYTPPTTGAFGQISFIYRVTVEGVVETNTITVTELTVSAPDRTLTVNEAVPNVTPQGTPLQLSATVSVNLPATFTIVTHPSLGTATIVGDVLTYTPRAFDFNQTVFTDSIVYLATVNGVSDTGVIAVTINPTLLPPTAVADTVNAVADTSTTYTSAQLTQNDTPARPNPSGLRPVVTAASAIPGTTAGTVVFNPANNSVTFTPTPGFVGITSFDYTMTSEGQTSTATVTVNVREFVPSTISGSIFIDYIESVSRPIRNHVRDANEPAMGGVPVRLTSPPDQNAFGQQIDQVVLTNADGHYLFDDVPPGIYQVTFETPNTLIFGTSFNASDLPAQSSGRTFTIEVGEEGGLNYAGLDFTVLGRTGLAQGTGALLVSQYLLSDPNSPYNSSRPEFGLATMIVNPSNGDQQVFELTQGFDNVLFAEIAVGRSGATALLTLIMEDGTVRTALLSKENGDFVVNSTRAVVQVFRNVNSLTFIDSAEDALQREYGNYRDSVDQVLAAGIF
jgi:hypothetical protein